MRSVTKVGEALGINTRVKAISVCARAPVVLATALAQTAFYRGVITLELAHVALRASRLLRERPGHLARMVFGDDMPDSAWEEFEGTSLITQLMRGAPEKKVVNEVKLYVPHLLTFFDVFVEHRVRTGQISRLRASLERL